MNVPADMFAMIHQGEIIIPSGASDAIRAGEATFGRRGATSPSTMRAEIHHTLDARNLPAGVTASEVAGILNAGLDATGLLREFGLASRRS
jgi:hypothetical protein